MEVIHNKVFYSQANSKYLYLKLKEYRDNKKEK